MEQICLHFMPVCLSFFPLTMCSLLWTAQDTFAKVCDITCKYNSVYITFKIIHPLLHPSYSPQLIAEERNICKAEGLEWICAAENTFGNKPPNIMLKTKQNIAEQLNLE